MRLLRALLAACAVTSQLAVQGRPHPAKKDPAQEQWERVMANYSRTAWTRLARNPTPECNVKTVTVRKAWESMRPEERIAYSDAVQCLTTTKSWSSPDVVPGARNRIDDFLVSHINQTNIIHWTGIFLSWHRLFIWHYEKALREECGYTGAQPYWDWPVFSDDPTLGPMFNGKIDSLGSNGISIPHGAQATPPLGPLPQGSLPPGSGGGCVFSGPFTNFSVNLGPIGLGPEVPADAYEYKYNPRCLKRDVNSFWSRSHTTYENVTYLLRSDVTPDLDAFQNVLGDPKGVHGGGHFTLGGDPGNDIYSSPGDPVFYMHHGGIDKMWTMWQEMDYENRFNQIAGTFTLLNFPPSANMTLDDTLDMGVINGWEKVPIRELTSTTAGRFCYIYE